MRGVTLAETILSFSLLLLVVIFVLNLYPGALGSVRISGEKVQADSLADSILEEWSAKPFNQLTVAAPVALPDVSGRGTVFHPTLEIFDVAQPDTSRDQILGLRVVVSWEDHGMRREVVRQLWRPNVPR